jgi:hypothetical protein
MYIPEKPAPMMIASKSGERRPTHRVFGEAERAQCGLNKSNVISLQNLSPQVPARALLAPRALRPVPLARGGPGIVEALSPFGMHDQSPR